jgi:hypothetical protein
MGNAAAKRERAKIHNDNYEYNRTYRKNNIDSYGKRFTLLNGNKSEAPESIENFGRSKLTTTIVKESNPVKDHSIILVWVLYFFACAGMGVAIFALIEGLADAYNY